MVVYTAPEIYNVAGIGAQYTQKVDIFSFGIMLWELWTRFLQNASFCDGKAHGVWSAGVGS